MPRIKCKCLSCGIEHTVDVTYKWKGKSKLMPKLCDECNKVKLPDMSYYQDNIEYKLKAKRKEIK